jgi:hypothetical protein
MRQYAYASMALYSKPRSLTISLIRLTFESAGASNATNSAILVSTIKTKPSADTMQDWHTSRERLIALNFMD